ncbi:MAG: response regulator transcription factor [Pseudomonadales bacterium]
MNKSCALNTEVSANKQFQPARILLVEDDKTVNDSLADALQSRGYQVRQCFDGRDGLLTAINQSFHLILLDKLLPVIDGLEVLLRLRQYRDTPVIMLTACGAEQDRIDGFSSGADDYLPKPFNMTELQLRIEALLRRSMRLMEDEQVAPELLRDGVLQLDAVSQTACCAGNEINLTPIEYCLLEVFLRQRDEVLSKPYLYQLVLSKPFSRYDRSLDMHISNLRAKLVKVIPEKKLIKTVHGKGYCYQ